MTHITITLILSVFACYVLTLSQIDMQLKAPATEPVHETLAYISDEQNVQKSDVNNKHDDIAKQDTHTISKPFYYEKNSGQRTPLEKLRRHCQTATVHPGAPLHQSIQKYAKQFKQAKSEKIWVNKPEVKSQLDYIINQLEKRDLPGELALIPMIESNFKTQARSHRGAVGLWQFMPKTGRAFGLNCSAKNDARKDVKASTRAALDYLEYLHKRFNKDWMLALAAYNAGEGTVKRAISRNKRQGKGTSFWSLKLPYETTQYVPKILGLMQYVKQLN